MKLNKGQILSNITNEQVKDYLPEIRSGDHVTVVEKIIEGVKVRAQKFIGTVIRVRGSGNSKTIIVRKEVNGVFVEKSYMIHSPNIISIEVTKHNKVRRNYISYIRYSKKKMI